MDNSSHINNSSQINNSSHINPFEKLDPLKRKTSDNLHPVKQNSDLIVNEFIKLIQNKDKQFLQYVQLLLNKRLLEFK